VLMTTTMVSGAVVQAQGTKMEQLTDLNAVLSLMKGQVDLYGDQFGSVQLQRGLLSLAQSKQITVRVLTTPRNAVNMRPLKAVGAQVFTLPSKFTGSMIIVRGQAVILPLPRGGYNVLRSPAEVGQMQGVMEQYWRVSTPY
jgi:hypothetical protein